MSSISKRRRLSRPAAPTQPPTVSTGRLSPTQTQSSSGTLSPPPHPPMRASSRHRDPSRTRRATSSSADDMIDSNTVENGSGRLPTIRDIEQEEKPENVKT